MKIFSIKVVTITSLRTVFSGIKIVLDKKIPRKFNSGPQNQLYCIKKMIKKSNGKIICLLDSDDFFYKNKLKTVFYSFKNTNSKFFFDKPENKSFFILPQPPSLQEHNDIIDFGHLF